MTRHFLEGKALYWVPGARQVQLINWPARVIFGQTGHLGRERGSRGDLSSRLYQQEIFPSEGPVLTAPLSDEAENPLLSPTHSFTRAQMRGNNRASPTS